MSKSKYDAYPKLEDLLRQIETYSYNKGMYAEKLSLLAYGSPSWNVVNKEYEKYSTLIVKARTGINELFGDL